MSKFGEFLSDEFEALREVRDELRVQAELGSMDLRDSWDELEKGFSRLEGQLKSLGETAMESADDIQSAAKLLSDELKEGYDRLRARL